MGTWWAAPMAAAGLALASPAMGAAPPVIVVCEGVLATQSDGDVASTAYYKIALGGIEEWNSAGKAWDANLCARKGYVCSIRPRSFRAEGTFSSDLARRVRHVLAIDRTSGKVEESWTVKLGDAMDFTGDCRPSQDPAVVAGPTKF